MSFNETVKLLRKGLVNLQCFKVVLCGAFNWIASYYKESGIEDSFKLAAWGLFVFFGISKIPETKHDHFVLQHFTVQTWNLCSSDYLFALQKHLD